MGNMNYAEHFDSDRSLKRQYEEQGYTVIRQFVSKETCDLLKREAWDAFSEGKTYQDICVKPAHSFFNLPFHTNFHEALTPIVGDILGKKLRQRYNYGRIYVAGSTLRKHTDRWSCEVSVSLTLDYDSETNWPLYFSPCPNHIETPVELEVGDIALYKGPDILHWRDEFEGNTHTQLFFHWTTL
jgi:hypothetical protein